MTSEGSYDDRFLSFGTNNRLGNLIPLQNRGERFIFDEGKKDIFIKDSGTFLTMNFKFPSLFAYIINSPVAIAIATFYFAISQIKGKAK